MAKKDVTFLWKPRVWGLKQQIFLYFSLKWDKQSLDIIRFYIITFKNDALFIFPTHETSKYFYFSYFKYMLVIKLQYSYSDYIFTFKFLNWNSKKWISSAERFPARFTSCGLAHERAWFWFCFCLNVVSSQTGSLSVSLFVFESATKTRLLLVLWRFNKSLFISQHRNEKLCVCEIWRKFEELV